jgi:glycosyltransferase involved in cell wall biosynthesis
VLRHRRVNAVVRDILLEDRVELVSLHLEDTYHLYPRTVRGLGLPTVVTLHSPLLDVPPGRPLDPVRARRRRTLSRTLTGVDGLTYQSEAELSSLEVLPRPLRCRPEQIPNGVNLAAMERAGRALDGDRFRLVFMGGGRWQKGAALAVRTLALLCRQHDVELHMLGNIPPGHEARRLAKELGVEGRTAFHGFIPAPRAFDYLNSADVVLIPSLSEGFSITAVEAMALGKPIVATNVGGIPTAVRDGRNALLVPPDPAELARSAARLIEDPGRREAMAWANRADAQDYDWSLVSERYLRYFAEVMERTVGPRGAPAGALAGDA